MAVEKGIKDAKKSLYKINLVGKTIPHKVDGRASSTKVALVPASPGTGVIAGSCARAVLDAAGVHDVLTKVFGSTSAKNVVKATLNGLLQLKSKEQIEEIRGVKVEAVNK
jgi:small subunit ribosomal protein S5